MDIGVNLNQLERMDGLEWKTSEQIPIGFGISKLSISCHVEDDKVSIVKLQEQIESFGDFIQSTDIQSFTKL